MFVQYNFVSLFNVFDNVNDNIFTYDDEAFLLFLFFCRVKGHCVIVIFENKVCKLLHG